MRLFDILVSAAMEWVQGGYFFKVIEAECGRTCMTFDSSIFNLRYNPGFLDFGLLEGLNAYL